MWWQYSHPLLLVRFLEQDGILKRILLSLPRPDEPSDNHPYCEIFQNYLEKKPVTWPPYDISLLTPFQKKVFSHVVGIPYGKIKTYREIAFLLENPNSQRAVAMALKHNPFPLVIPCHRVVSSHFPQEIGGYTPSPDIKKILLQLENAFS